MSKDILSRLQSAKNEEEREWVILEFSLENLEKKVQEAVWASAIPHWFDENFLAALLSKPVNEIEGIYDHLRKLSFIEVFPERGHNVHERTRKLLLNHLWKDDIERYRELSRRAMEYSVNLDQNDVSCRVEWIYHMLIASPEEGARQIQAVNWEWHKRPNFAYDKIESMIRAVREHVDAGRLAENIVPIFQFWDALIDFDYSRFYSAKNKFSQIEVRANMNKKLKADIHSYFGGVLMSLDEYDASKKHYQMAIVIYREINDKKNEADCMVALGDLYLIHTDHKKAQDYFGNALEIYFEIGSLLGQADCIRALGDVYRELGEYDQAYERYKEALSIFRKNGDRVAEADSLQSMGYVNLLLGKYKTAKKQNDEALSIYRIFGDRMSEANSILYSADIDRFREKWIDAKQKYLEILPYYQNAGLKYNTALVLQRLGDIEKELGNSNQAGKYYQDALEISARLGSSLSSDLREDLSLLPDLNKKRNRRKSEE